MSGYKVDHEEALSLLRDGVPPKEVAAAYGSGLSVIYWLQKKAEIEQPIEVPRWVPKEYVEDYQIIAEEDGEEAAAAYVRRKKRGNVQKLDEVKHEVQIAAPDLRITREAYLAAMAELKPSEQSVRSAIRITAAVTGKTIQQIASPERTYDITRARHIAVYIAARSTDLSNAQIGRHFGDRDHTSLIHAKKRVAAVMTAHGIEWSEDAVKLAQSLWNVDWRARKAS